MLKINYEVKKIKNLYSREREALTGDRIIDEGFDDAPFYVCEALRDMLQDLQDVMDPNQWEEVYTVVKRGDLL